MGADMQAQQQTTQDILGDLGPVGREERALIHDWRESTAARVVSPTMFEMYKKWGDYHVVGITGFSASAPPEFSPEDARAELKNIFTQLKEKYGDKLVISSGATMLGVPKIAYELCDELKIKCMGVACEKAREYPLANMHYFVPVGQNWGDESATFLQTADELIALGGGEQARRETIAALTEKMPVTVVQGFGGKLTAEDIVGAKIVERSSK